MTHEELLRQVLNVNPGQDAQLQVCQQRIAELERWQKVDLENYKQHLAELEEMLTAATDVAVQRGKQLGEVEGLARRALSVGAHPDAPLFSPRVVLAAMGGADAS